MENSPEQILHKAAKVFHEVTGMEYQTMGELEYMLLGIAKCYTPFQTKADSMSRRLLLNLSNYVATACFILPKLAV